MTEAQRDKLAGFRVALRGARPKAREAGGPLHRLALRVGVQMPGGFAPARRPAGRGRRPNRRREMEFATLAVRASAPVGWPRGLGMAGMVRSGRRQPVAAQRRGSALPGWLRRGVGGAAVRSWPVPRYAIWRPAGARPLMSRRRAGPAFEGRVSIIEPRPALGRPMAPVPRGRRRQHFSEADGGMTSAPGNGFEPMPDEAALLMSADEMQGALSPPGLGRSGSEAATFSRVRSPAWMGGLELADALDEYFFQQSRLAPRGAASFDPRVSPLWAGLKLPG